MSIYVNNYKINFKNCYNKNIVIIILKYKFLIRYNKINNYNSINYNLVYQNYYKKIKKWDSHKLNIHYMIQNKYNNLIMMIIMILIYYHNYLIKEL